MLPRYQIESAIARRPFSGENVSVTQSKQSTYLLLGLIGRGLNPFLSIPAIIPSRLWGIFFTYQMLLSRIFFNIFYVLHFQMLLSRTPRHWLDMEVIQTYFCRFFWGLGLVIWTFFGALAIWTYLGPWWSELTWGFCYLNLPTLLWMF